MTLIRCIKIIFFQAITLTLIAQAPVQHHLADKITEPWRWTRFEELSDMGLRCMAEGDNEGLLFGVDEGIMKYTGYNWTMISLPDSISELSITALCMGLDGSIWVGTDAGLLVVRNGNWVEIFPEVGEREAVVTDIIRLPGGSLLVGLDDGGGDSAISGLLHIDNNNKTLYCSAYSYQQLARIPDRDYNLLTISESLTIPNLNGLGVFNIKDLHILRDGRIVIAISNKHSKGKISICSFHRGAPGNLLVEEVFTKDEGLSIRSSVNVTESLSGELWVVSTTADMGIQLYKNGAWQEIRTSDIFGGLESHNSVLACSDGSIWIEGNGSIFVMNNGRWRVYEHPEIPITSASKYVFYEASDEKIWVLGELDELFLFDNTFEKWITYEGLIFQGETSSGESWYLQRDGKVILNRHGEWLAYGERDGLMDTPARIFITSEDVIWAVGSHRQSAATAYLQNDEWEMMVHPELSWGIDHKACYEADDGSLWFGCGIDLQRDRGQKGGLIRFHTNDNGNLEWNRLPKEENIVIANAYGIGSSKNGSIWVGGRPLWTYNEGTWTKFTDDKRLEEYVDDVDTDAQGNLWLASRYYGIFRYDGKSWKNYTTDNGLPSNNIISIFAESDSVVWATTHGGVSLFDGERWTDVDFLGVMSLVTEGGTIMKGKKGHIWFNNSTIDWYKRGLTRENTDPKAYEVFKTIRYTPDQIPPETRFISYEKRFRQQEDAYIFWEGRDYFNETPVDKLQYSWRLNDNAWSAFSNKIFHRFNGLKPGRYRMEVRTRDMCLNVDPSAAAIEFRVMTPWWKHPAFVLITILIFGLIVFLQYRILSNNKKLHVLNESLENKSEELNNALEKKQKLIYSRLRFFTNISHEFRTPLGLIMGPVEELKESNNQVSSSTRKKYYEIIHRNAGRILRLINQILEVYKVEESTLEFKPMQGDLILQVNGIIDLFGHLADQHG
ncbi:MAG TPA: histidine kinase dimerization/phospho-acceptor domain-containing protein, partial [Bacteroidales bacterium]|nr:histidine kinase dimerization/phospho-acceptor domain-containing protein [Bacteroidales bacterium]